jgi:hypothetical protein
MNSSNSIKNAKVTDYWAEFYIQDKLCSLCGNNGVIDTTGVKTPLGKETGRKNFCICPNGQSIRKHMVKETGNRQVLPE